MTIKKQCNKQMYKSINTTVVKSTSYYYAKDFEEAKKVAGNNHLLTCVSKIETTNEVSLYKNGSK